MEGKLGRMIHRAGNIWAHVQEGHRLDREERRTTRDFQRMLERFGGASGTEVTLDQVREYLATDLRSINAINNASQFMAPTWSPRTPLVQRLERAQDLRTLEGREKAIGCFNETREQEVTLALMLFGPEDKKDPQVVEYERRLKAYDTAIRVLSL